VPKRKFRKSAALKSKSRTFTCGKLAFSKSKLKVGGRAKKRATALVILNKISANIKAGHNILFQPRQPVIAFVEVL